MPDCAVHYLWLAFVCFLNSVHPPPLLLSDMMFCFVFQTQCVSSGIEKKDAHRVHDIWFCTCLFID